MRVSNSIKWQLLLHWKLQMLQLCIKSNQVLMIRVYIHDTMHMQFLYFVTIVIPYWPLGGLFAKLILKIWSCQIWPGKSKAGKYWPMVEHFGQNLCFKSVSKEWNELYRFGNIIKKKVLSHSQRPFYDFRRWSVIYSMSLIQF